MKKGNEMNAADVEIHSLPELRKYIKEASLIVGMLRFGTIEKWIKISKKEALFLIQGIPDTATPEECEMFGGNFGSLEIDDQTGEMTLFLG